jgi:hypothetical protein
MGGKDKGAPYAPLLPLVKDRVREVLLIGAAADRIAQELSGAVELIHAGNLETAVPEAFQRARPGDVVLLAPACSSFDQFQDYEQRGRVFKDLVGRLAQDVGSGAVEWKWKKREATSGRLDVSARVQTAPPVPGQVQVQPSGGSSQEAPQVAAEPKIGTPAPEVVDRQAAAPAGEHAEHLADRSRPTEPPTHELTLVYEFNADEYFPADVAPEQDYSEQPETRQLRTPANPEKVDGSPLPYEGGFEEQGPAAGESTDVHDSETSMNEAEPGPKIAEEKKSNSAERSESAQLRLPRMDE